MFWKNLRNISILFDFTFTNRHIVGKQSRGDEICLAQGATLGYQHAFVARQAQMKSVRFIIWHAQSVIGE